MLEKRSLTLLRHRTSIALEPEFWAALEAIAGRENSSLAGLIARLDEGRLPEQKLASALRVFVLNAK